MNREHTLFHLQEASEELARIINEIKTDKSYSSAELYVSMTHLYHHINTAWNAREVSPSQAQECSEENFKLWQQFPTDIGLSNER